MSFVAFRNEERRHVSVSLYREKAREVNINAIKEQEETDFSF